MKIVTVNVPESYIDAINKLVGENGLYPSRSELIRVSVREFLLKELRMAKHLEHYKSDEDFNAENPEFNGKPYDGPENYIRVPKITDNLHDFECPRCKKIFTKRNSDSTYYCPNCYPLNMRLKLINSRENPVREFKTYKILRRLEH